MTTKKKIRISNVHLEARCVDSALHVKHLSKLLGSDIILGDFNEFPGKPGIELLLENNYNVIPRRLTFIDGEKRWTIDYVFYKGKFKEIQWKENFTGVTKDHPSDHLWIIVEI